MQKVKSPDSVEGSEAKYWKFGWECPHGESKSVSVTPLPDGIPLLILPASTLLFLLFILAILIGFGVVG